MRNHQFDMFINIKRNHFLFCGVVFIVFLSTCHFLANGEKLIYSAVIFRHGDRTPTSMYPTSRYKNESYWPMGYGQLTKIGKQRSYQLGSWMKERYDSLLATKNAINKVYTVSTDPSRTIMSGECVLTALLPPNEDEVIFPEIGKWQPVPVRTLSKSQDNMLAFTRPCPRYYTEIKKLHQNPEIMQLIESTRDLVDYVMQHSGYSKTEDPLVDFSKILTVKQAIDSLRTFNYTIDDWLEKIEKNLTEVSHYPLLAYTYTDELQKLRAGPLVTDILTGMKEKIKNGQDGLALKLYASHDYVLMGLMNALKCNEKFKQIPFFSSALLFELYEDELKHGDDKHSIKVFFKNPLKELEEEVRLPHCDHPCTVTNFELGYSSLLFSGMDWEIGCQLTGGFLDNIPLTTISLFTVGGFSVAILIYVKFSKTDNRLATNLLDILRRFTRSSPPRATI